MDTIQNYKCPCCGAPLVFDAESQNLHCESCENTFQLETMQQMAEGSADSGGASKYDWEHYEPRNFEDTNEVTLANYSCPSCGAEITGDDSPKVIESTEIISFDCELSFIATVLDEENELEGKVYKMSAALEDDTVKAKIDWYDRTGAGDKSEFETDISFMTKLQEIVSKYNFVQHNGYSHHVSGLPNMYGDYIDIKYASGESIYASDNQSGFLATEAAMELINLFLSFNT